MADDHDDRPEYDPTAPTPPERDPPARRTAPQSTYTDTQVVIGAVVTLAGLVLTFGLPLVLA